MELFPPQPDLSLQISPPNTKQEDLDQLCFWKRALDHSTNNININTTSKHGLITNSDLSLSHPIHYGLSPELSFLKPIKGIPIYQNTLHSPIYPFPNFTPTPSSTSTITSSSSSSGNLVNYNLINQNQARFMTRLPMKRTVRAPRMRWTTTLHARFVHAVELLGGHERATPKSVLELMDVKDLTLAHVKSHLQMYRTIKTTDRPAASSERSEVYENGSSGDTSEDVMCENFQSPRKSQVLLDQPKMHQDNKDYGGLWSNSSSREAWLHGKKRDHGGNMSFLENLDPKCLSLSDVSSSNLSYTTSCSKKPNLEFTLGITPRYS